MSLQGFAVLQTGGQRPKSTSRRPETPRRSHLTSPNCAPQKPATLIRGCGHSPTESHPNPRPTHWSAGADAPASQASIAPPTKPRALLAALCCRAAPSQDRLDQADHVELKHTERALAIEPFLAFIARRRT